ncbi:hypothetical protein A3860_04950 [Niastella vici]|uniref:Glycosyltransferase RgtA/B/C/D-like domain-containing protein n=1 Tax=Niastella vici TaxID=1703345 RepID=A0A1V9FRW5_9BACT|nr:hypothetical protein [Niastella vici]OQP61068.1 hypothetical protein A3860_04950 [Niastella vici]
MNKQITPTYKNILAIITATVVLCFMAFHNRYPLIFNCDSAMYIEAANMGMVRADRPILYGLFVMFMSLHKSLWLVVVVQAMIVAFVVNCYFRYFTSAANYIPYYLSFIVLISFFMGGSFVTSWLMPDVFTPLSILCIGLLLFIEKLKLAELIVISILTVVSIAMHNSHFFICLSFTLLLLAGFAFRQIRYKYQAAGIQIKRLLFTIVLVVVSNVFLSAVHYKYSGEFKASRGGPIFLMGSFIEMGVVDTYLAENCGRKNYKLCQYRKALPNNFMWASKSPIHKTGGWEGNELEYSAIIKDILTTPAYLKTVVYNSIILTSKQFFHFETGEAGVPLETVVNVIQDYYPNEALRFMNARQSNGTLHFEFINHTQTLIVGICLFLFLLVFIYGKLTVRFRLLIIFILTALLLNAWFCGTFSGVYPRYQDRLVWLLPLPLFLYAMELAVTDNLFYSIKKKLNLLYVEKRGITD